MSRSKGARALILQALGSPEIDSAPDALGCVLAAMQAEAEMLVQGENLGPDHEVLEYAHLTRLRTLKDFVDQYVTVTWRETKVEAKLEAAE